MCLISCLMLEFSQDIKGSETDYGVDWLCAGQFGWAELSGTA
jgi:hypothetical protein